MARTKSSTGSKAKTRRGPISPSGNGRLALRSKTTAQRIRLSDDQSPAVAEDRRRKRKRGVKTRRP